MAVDLKDLSQAIIVGDHIQSAELTQRAISEGVPPGDIINKGLIPGMNEVGRLFKTEEYFLPEVIIAARAMHASMNAVKPLLVQNKVAPLGRVAAGTVKGDLHDVGKNLVCMMLEGTGFDVVDLGVDVSPEKFVAVVRDDKVNMIAMSAMLTSTMISMKATIDALTAAGLRSKVKVVIGGAPVTQHYAKEINADGYAPDATSAAETAKKLMA
jgi:5-methyltetrahydrofolate--homocysteine methyltransferase